jgi:hypothetical protein
VSVAEDELLEPSPTEEDQDEGTELEPGPLDEEPDVLLDVPELRVEEISLEVQDLRAHVALHADVLELLKLHVGVDAELGRVQLTIKGVEAQVLLKVHLDNVARILDRVLTTIDNNPAIVERLTEHVGRAAEEVGSGAGQAVGDLGAGAGSGVEELVKGGGEALGEVGRGARTAVEDVSEAAGTAVDELGDQTSAKRPKKRQREGEAPSERPRRRSSKPKRTSGERPSEEA